MRVDGFVQRRRRGLCEGVQAFRMCDPQYVTDDLTEAVLAGFFAKAVFGTGAR